MAQLTLLDGRFSTALPAPLFDDPLDEDEVPAGLSRCVQIAEETLRADYAREQCGRRPARWAIILACLEIAGGGAIIATGGRVVLHALGLFPG